MPAIGLSLALFLYWWVVGYAILAASHDQRNLRQNALLAPSVGAAATVLTVFWLSRLGLPVGLFGTRAAIGLAVVAAALLAWRRPVVPLRRLLPFAGVLLGALVLIARPMLEAGLEWISYGNDDMGFYVLAAERLLRHGFFDPPDAIALARGLDYASYMWFPDVLLGHRVGPQMLLAWVASVTRLAPYQVFMPAIVALELALIAAVGALVCRVPPRRAPALAACAVLAVAPLPALGVLNQLLAQVWGLGLLATLVALLCRRVPAVGLRRLIRLGVTPAVVAAGLTVVYSEITALVAIAIGLFLTVAFLRRLTPPGPMLAMAAAGGLLTLLALNVYVRDALRFLVFVLFVVPGRVQGTDPQTLLFPTFLVPSGLAVLWGIRPVGGGGSEPWESASILLGAALLLAAVASVLALGWRGEPIALVCLPMLVLGSLSFAQRYPFILYKLAMYVLPFLAGSLVVALYTFVRRPVLRAAPLVLLGLAGLGVQAAYVDSSLSVRSELADGSRRRAVSQFRRQVVATAPRTLDLDTASPIVAKLQAASLVGISTTFLARDFWPPASLARNWTTPFAVLAPPPDTARVYDSLTGDRLPRSEARQFALLADGDPDQHNAFVVTAPRATRRSDVPCDFYGLTTGRQAIFNRRRPPPAGEDFVLVPCAAVQNYLVFVHSERGQHYYRGEARRISLYKLESDPLFYRDQTMAGIGRHLLFEALNPSPRVRLSLTITRSFAGDGENRLPPAAVIGGERRPLALVGRGSARVFSPPVDPQLIGGRPYLALDMGVDGTRFPEKRRGLMALYGRDVALDIRRVVAFARDISLVSEAEYEALRPPAAVRAFPADLANPDVEYAGLYEDGWVGEEAYVYLTSPGPRSTLLVRGTVPRFLDAGFETECVVAVDGREVARRGLGPGDFTVAAPAAGGPGRARIEVRFSRIQRLPAPDSRPVGARLLLVGFDG